MCLKKLANWCYSLVLKIFKEETTAFEFLLTLDIDIPTILEEQEDEDINDCPITEEDTAIGVDQNNLPSVPTSDDSISPSPHVLIVSQTQQDDENYPPSDDNNRLNGLIMDEGTNLDAMSVHINTQLDKMDDVLSAELETIMDHRYLSGIIEIQVRYTNGYLS